MHIETAKRFAAGFLITLVVGLALNLLPLLLTLGADNTDGFEIIGFPLTFRRLGGYVCIDEFDAPALFSDIALAIAAAIVAGYSYTRLRHIPMPSTPQFSLRNLMLAVACFAVAAAWVAANLRRGQTEWAVFTIIFLPVAGPAIGGGIGLLIGRFRRRVTMGLLFHLSALAVWMLFGPKI